MFRFTFKPYANHAVAYFQRLVDSGTRWEDHGRICITVELGSQEPRLYTSGEIYVTPGVFKEALTKLYDWYEHQ